MHKPTLARLIAAPFLFAVVLLIAAWTSGFQEIICEQTKSGEEQCARYNLAAYYLVQIRRTVDENDGLITALATIVIAAFTAALWRSTDKLWLAGEEQKAISKNLADIAERQMAIAGEQTDIIAKQHAIGRLQFIATHRPRIIVREVHAPMQYGPGPFFITYTLANVGGTLGTVVNTDVFAEFVMTPAFLEVPRARRPEQFRIDAYQGVKDIPLASGESIEIGFPFHDVMTDDERIQPTSDPNGLPFFVGRIIYVDESNVRRSTVFRRRYDPATRRFREWGDPELEYAD
jgi:hypothetical protein